MLRSYEKNAYYFRDTVLLSHRESSHAQFLENRIIDDRMENSIL